MNDESIRTEISRYRWYQPVQFGNGIFAANWAGAYTMASHEFGIKKWQYIVERNLPDIQGKRALDIGCNCGLFSIQLSRMGASQVVGVDSERTWPNWRSQALFVKEALEWRCGARYNVEFVEGSMDRIAGLGLGKFDFAMALCSIYYIGDEAIVELLSCLRKDGCRVVLLQGNTNRHDQKKEVFKRASPRYLSCALKQSGYDNITIDAPLFYSRPVVVGSSDPAVPVVIGRRDRIRDWIRRKI